jgi:hypothetical protein
MCRSVKLKLDAFPGVACLPGPPAGLREFAAVARAWLPAEILHKIRTSSVKNDKKDRQFESPLHQRVSANQTARCGSWPRHCHLSLFEVNARIIDDGELNLQATTVKKFIHRLPTSRKKPVIVDYDVAFVYHVVKKAFQTDFC